MMLSPNKTDFPTSNVRRYLEPGPIVLVSCPGTTTPSLGTLTPTCLLPSSLQSCRLDSKGATLANPPNHNDYGEGTCPSH